MINFVHNYNVNLAPPHSHSLDAELGEKILILYIDKYSNVFTFFFVVLQSSTIM
jgi:hypothetical protein